MQRPSKKHGRQGRRMLGLTAGNSLSGLLGQRSFSTVGRDHPRAAPLLPLSPPHPLHVQAAILPDWQHQSHLLHLQPCQPWPLRRCCFGKSSRCWAMGHLPHATHPPTSNQLSRQAVHRRPALTAWYNRSHPLVAAVGVAADQSGTSPLSAARSGLQHAFQAAIQAAKPRLAIEAARTVGRLKLLV